MEYQKEDNKGSKNGNKGQDRPYFFLSSALVVYL